VLLLLFFDKYFGNYKILSLAGNEGRERFSTFDHLIKIACYVKNKKYFFSFKSNCSELVGARSPTVIVPRGQF
jgi:hypothetical protein